MQNFLHQPGKQTKLVGAKPDSKIREFNLWLGTRDPSGAKCDVPMVEFHVNVLQCSGCVFVRGTMSHPGDEGGAIRNVDDMRVIH